MKPSFKHSLMIVLALLALTFGALGVTPAHAATIAVTNANDSGAGSLRQAIADAASGDIITFDGDYTIPLASPLLLDKDLTIDGSGHTVTVSGDTDGDGTGSVNVFVVNPSVTVTLQNLTVTKGYSSGNGGGLINSGVTTVRNVTFLDNHAAGRGGGIQNYGTLTVENSTFSGNVADTYGGGILINNGIVTVSNSTFYNNSAASQGGGIFTFGSLTLTNDTFSDNKAGSGSALRVGFGGSINSINSLFVKGASGDNCYGAISSGNNNLANDTSCGAPVINSSSILLGTLATTAAQPRRCRCCLAPLPLTRAIIQPARRCRAVITTSAASAAAGTCDIGAYEFEKAADDFVITVKTDNTGTSTGTQFTIPTYRGETYDYNVDCNNDGVNEASAQAGDDTCSYAAAGT